MAESATLPPVLTQLKWLSHAVSCLDICGREGEGRREGGREDSGGRERRKREREGEREGEGEIDETGRQILWSI